MRQLLPEPLDDVDPYEAYRADGPLLRANMVVSADGAATAADGRTGGLGSAGDLRVFLVLRALADAVLVGAATVVVEGYGPHRLRPDLAERRAAEGRHEPAAIVVVTASLDLDFDSPLFTDARTPTVVLTCAASPPQRLQAARRRARVLVAGDERVDLAAGLAALRRLGMTRLLCEGGPLLLGSLLSAGLVDELCLTLAPKLVGARPPRLVRDLAGPVALGLSALYEHDSELYLRYRVASPA